jgi:hypothetical protein
MALGSKIDFKLLSQEKEVPFERRIASDLDPK